MKLNKDNVEEILYNEVISSLSVAYGVLMINLIFRTMLITDISEDIKRSIRNNVK